MKLLVLTQKIDKNDTVLGFVHNWVLKLSEKFEQVTVICLGKGEFDLPKNVKIFSLGKEVQKSRLLYVKNFYQYVTGLHNEYNAVFVHMNQEYVLLGGLLWKLLGKKVYFWRNHPVGNFLTRIAVWLSDKVFYTAPNSYTARFGKSIKMPVGIDTSVFNTELRIMNYELRKNKILSLGRISPVKNIHLMVEAAKILRERGIDFVFDIVGDPANPEDVEYKEKLEKDIVNFLPGVPNSETPKLFNNYEIFINLTPSFDKTIIEASLCGAIVIVANQALKDELDQSLVVDLSPQNIASSIEYWLKASEDEKEKMRQKLTQSVSINHSLDALVKRLCQEI